MPDPRTCTRCGNTYPATLEFFYPAKSGKYGLQATCKSCRKEMWAEWRKKNRKRSNTYMRKYMKKYSSRMTNKEYEEMFDRQGGKCVICNGVNTKAQIARTKKTLYVDHDHKTGGVRGLLCSHCNTGLGMFKDDLRLLSRAAQYLNNGITI